jgi:hypothetical protein
MAHTPGPWSADYGDFAAYCETGAEVCEVTRGNHDDGTRIADDEMEANLRLVAAAPELLAALKRMREVFEQLSDDWRELDATYVDQLIDSDGLRGCDIAIAKAEGRGA